MVDNIVRNSKEKKVNFGKTKIKNNLQKKRVKSCIF